MEIQNSQDLKNPCRASPKIPHWASQKEFKKQLKKEINKRKTLKSQQLYRKQYYQNKKKQQERVMIIIKNIVENNISTP
jgi:hypothetical protein